MVPLSPEIVYAASKIVQLALTKLLTAKRLTLRKNSTFHGTLLLASDLILSLLDGSWGNSWEDPRKFPYKQRIQISAKESRLPFTSMKIGCADVWIELRTEIIRRFPYGLCNDFILLDTGQQMLSGKKKKWKWKIFKFNRSEVTSKNQIWKESPVMRGNSKQNKLRIFQLCNWHNLTQIFEQIDLRHIYIAEKFLKHNLIVNCSERYLSFNCIGHYFQSSKHFFSTNIYWDSVVFKLK